MCNMNELLVVGNDKIGRRLISKIKHRDNLYIAIDSSTSLKRIWDLVRRRRITPILVAKMAFAELLRKDYKIPEIPKIYSNSDLLSLIHKDEIDRVYLFRASLIINKEVLGSRAEILNVHCARIPDYGGLGSIMKALKDKAYEQEATLHRVTPKIDEGEIITTIPYRLDERLPYRQNEELAYNAGINLIFEQLRIA